MLLFELGEYFELSREFFVSLGVPGLFLVAFLEFFLLPVPPDFVLIPLAVATPELALFYAAVATAGSVSAGLVGYAIGRTGGRPALESRFAGERVERAEAHFEEYGMATIAVGAFAPIPEGYELLSISAGAVGLDLRSYLVASLAGRGGKYLVEAMLVLAFGTAAQHLSEFTLYSILGGLTVVAIAAFLLREWWLPEHWRVLGE